jgi:hypothetical protein
MYEIVKIARKTVNLPGLTLKESIEQSLRIAFFWKNL